MIVFEPFLTLSGAVQGHFGWIFGPFWGRSGVTLGSLGDNFGIGLASFWGRFDPILRPFWVLFRTSAEYFSPFSRLGHIALVTGLSDYYIPRLLYTPIIRKTPIIIITEGDY